jgi:GT2 family glycosyltransferase
VVVNNSPELAEELSERWEGVAGVRILEIGYNAGFAAGANFGLSQVLRSSDSDVVVIGSHDLHVEPEALGTLVRALRSDDRLAAVGPVLTEKEAGSNSRALVAGRTGVVETEWLSGTCLVLRVDAVREIGGFDEALGSYSEDVDWCRRAHLHGWRVGVVASARAHGLGTGSVRRKDWNRINTVRMDRIHGGWRRCLLSYGREWRRVAALVASACRPNRSWSARRELLKRSLDVAYSLTRLKVLFTGPQVPSFDRG